jgi:hypothetical protein
MNLAARGVPYSCTVSCSLRLKLTRWQPACLPLLCLQAMTPENIQFTYDQGAADAAAWLEANRMVVAAKKQKDGD